MNDKGFADVAVPVLILLALVVVAYLGMWRGWRNRARRHDLPPLVPTPDELAPATLQGEGRYFGTTVAGSWLDRVVSRGLGARSTCRLSLSADGLDVIRTAGSFRVPAGSLRGARHDQGIAGTVVPPHGVLVVTWQHGDLLLDSGFRLDPGGTGSTTDAHDEWVRSISTIAKEHSA
ncbi:MAG TPA: hypothetical protein VF049_20420 [Nocardioidaceae bacterium]|jgi:hypothetical protein